MSLSSFLLAFFLCVISVLLFLSFRLGVTLQRSFCISVLLSFRLGATLQLCFVLAVFLCFFLSARLVIIHVSFCLPCCLVRNHADLTCLVLTVFLFTFRCWICILWFSYCFNEIRRIYLFCVALLIVVDACLGCIFIEFQEDSEKLICL